MKKRLLITVMATLTIFSSLIGLVGCSPKHGGIKNITIDGDLRVGVFSDAQLNKTGSYDSLYGNHLRKTFELFKAQKVNLIIFGGDLADLVSNEVYETHNKIFDEVFADNKPEKLYIMGNHDYWYENDYSSTTGKQKKFQKYINQSPWEHRVYNGFHFIACSPSRGAGLDEKEIKWLKKQLDIAVADGGATKPIFVNTHHNVPDTVYGSEDWSDKALKGIFDEYPQVVSFSGHSHNSLLDERSIHQDKFTSIQTQSISYIEQGGDYKYNADEDKYTTIPPNAEDAPMCYIMNLTDTKMELERWNIIKSKEEKSNMRWSMEYSESDPITAGSFKYKRELIQTARLAPTFPSNATISAEIVKTNKTNNIGLVFTAATHNDSVYAYSVILEEQNTGKTYSYSYFSDYYNGIDDMAKEVKLGLPSQLPSGKYVAKVYAQESFGQFSPTSLVSTPFNYTKA